MKNILTLTLLLISLTYAISGKKIISGIKERFEEMKTFETEFVQTQFWELAQEESKINGKMYMKGQDSFRIEMPKGDYILSNSETVWRYSTENSQILIENIKKNEDTLLPGKIFFDFTDKYELVDYFEKEENGKDIYILNLKSPSDKQRFIDKLKVKVSEDFIPYWIEYYDLDDNRSVYELNDIKVDEKIDDSKFKFYRSEGIEIIDLRDKK